MWSSGCASNICVINIRPHFPYQKLEILFSVDFLSCIINRMVLYWSRILGHVWNCHPSWINWDPITIASFFSSSPWAYVSRSHPEYLSHCIYDFWEVSFWAWPGKYQLNCHARFYVLSGVFRTEHSAPLTVWGSPKEIVWHIVPPLIHKSSFYCYFHPNKKNACRWEEA